MASPDRSLPAAVVAIGRLCRTSTLCALISSCAGLSTSQAANSAASGSLFTDSTVEISEKLTTMLLDSGIQRLYTDLATTVLAESAQTRQACNDPSAKADAIQQFIGQVLEVESMVDESVKQMTRHMPPTLTDSVAVWMASPAGKRIMDAEVSSADWDGDEYNRRQLELTHNSDYNETRQRLILNVIDSSMTVNFVAALHTETTALVLQTGDCIANNESRSTTSQTVMQTQGDEEFYGALLRNDIHTTAAMIFSDISSADLEAYVAHNQSTAARTWNAALLQSIRQTLRDRHPPLQRYLASFNTNE